MTGTRNLRPTRPWLFLLLFGVLLAAGCTSGTGDSGLNLITPAGSHPEGFLSTHPAFAVSDATQCASCHGSDLAGGIAKTSCFTSACHHETKTGWALPAQHGAAAKRTPGASGFVSCKICHGSGFSGGGSGVSCFTCHGVNAPHSPKPWRTTGGTNHDNTDVANAPVCAACHYPGSPNNPAGHPATPAPAGTAPGCFNSTLCHGADVAPHILGATWTEPTSASFHGLQAKQNLASCQTCHGTPGTILFEGGAASTKCSTCHTAAKAHPATWYRAAVATFPGYVPSHRNSSNQSTACSICHDYTQGRTAPNSSAPSCFSASYSNAEHASVGCHANGPGAPNHAVPFLDPVHLGVKQADFDGDCSNCHAVSGTSPVSAAPACQVCHTAGSPLSPTGSFGVCTSCHGNPPDGGAGAAYPNIAGAHAAHIALNLSGTPVDCDTCHSGLGFVTQAHYDRANGRTGAGGRVPPGDLAFVATYNAKTGASSFSSTAFTCSNVSCHGGQANLNWRTGTLDVNGQCTSCHASGTSQYNSYNSGEHTKHVSGEGIECTACHNTVTLAVNHFTALGTTTMEGPASATIGGGTTEIPSGSYNTVTRSCDPSCHGAKTW